MRPIKVVAGLEADKTNLLFLAMYKAATAKHDWEKIAKRIKNGDASNTEEKPAKKEKQPEKPKEEKVEEKKVDKEKERKEKERANAEKAEKEKAQAEKERAEKERQEKEKEKERKRQEKERAEAQAKANANANANANEDEFRPVTAKSGPPRNKMNENNFDQIVVEEKNAMPQGIILDNDDQDEDEKNTSFDHNVTRNNVNTENIDKNQHGYLVREVMEKNEAKTGQTQQQAQEEEKKSNIRFGNIGKKKKGQAQPQKNAPNAPQEEVIQIKVESIEDVEALCKAVQNLCQ